jgi:CRISPR-associated endonuclease/helicase Cas3
MSSDKDFKDQLIAHSANDEGKFHLLEEHLLAVAELCAQFADKFGMGDCGRLAGLLHDLGKLSPEFQRFIRDTAKYKSGGDHKGAGCRLAYEKDWFFEAFVVNGHHGGLRSRADVKDSALSADAAIVEQSQKLFEQLLSGFDSRDNWQLAGIENRFQVEFLVRMMFSALVDADFLDTESHIQPKKAAVRLKSFDLKSLFDTFINNHEALINEAEKSDINRTRCEIYHACLDAAKQPQGFFRLSVPTGGGKTRSSMAFALKHAVVHGLDRVITAIPYTSIIDQNAEIYRDIFGIENVLEHHSGVKWDAKADERADGYSWTRLASENWDAPIVVTTTVQLFDSMFSNKPSSCRKLHNIASSVLVLDEVQTLPANLLDPILDGLRQLVERYGVTVVLCTATQPAWEDNPVFKGLEEIREIVPDHERYFRDLARVTYQFPKEEETWSWQQVADRILERQQSLVVVNTRKDAVSLLDILEGQDGVLHLSTNLCGAHRKEVIGEIKHRLKNEKTCRVVSTQVVEAGVDVDFPFVLRAIGPLDRIIQAAGRCNREGKSNLGTVVVFNPANAAPLPPGEYRPATGIANIILNDPMFDPHSQESIRRFFSQFYQLVPTDLKKVMQSRKKLNFKETAEKFHLIEEKDTAPVIVPYNNEALEIIERIRQSDPGDGRWLFRLAQPFIITLYENEFNRARKANLLEEIGFRIYMWKGEYDKGLKGIIRSSGEL